MIINSSKQLKFPPGQKPERVNGLDKYGSAAVLWTKQK